MRLNRFMRWVKQFSLHYQSPVIVPSHQWGKVSKKNHMKKKLMKLSFFSVGCPNGLFSSFCQKICRVLYTRKYSMEIVHFFFFFLCFQYLSWISACFLELPCSCSRKAWAWLHFSRFRDARLRHTESSFLIVPNKGPNRKCSYFFEMFSVLKFRFFFEIWGFPLNLIAKTASPGPGVSVRTQGPRWRGAVRAYSKADSQFNSKPTGKEAAIAKPKPKAKTLPSGRLVLA